MPRAKTPKKEHPIKELLSYFDQAFRARFCQPCPIVGGRDSKLAQTLLKTYALTDLQRWIDAFFASFDQFIRNSTYGFNVFASCVGKLIAAERPAPHLKAKTLRTMQGVYGE